MYIYIDIHEYDNWRCSSTNKCIVIVVGAVSPFMDVIAAVKAMKLTPAASP